MKTPCPHTFPINVRIGQTFGTCTRCKEKVEYGKWWIALNRALNSAGVLSVRPNARTVVADGKQ